MTSNQVIPDDLFAALACGGGGERAMRFLAQTQRNKHLALLRMVVVAATQARHRRAVELARAYDVIAQAQTDRPAEVEPLLCHPPVGAWAIQVLHDLRRRADLDHGYLAGLAAVAVLLSGSGPEVEVPLHDRSLFLPFLGRAHLPITEPVRTAIVRPSAAGAEIVADGVGMPVPANPRLDGIGWQGIRRLQVTTPETTTSFLLDDLDPYRFPGHPQQERLDDIAVGQWQRALTDAWSLLRSHHPEAATEIGTGITVLVPLPAGPGQDTSATSRHSFGAIGLSRPTCRSLAVGLAHERQHAKLNAVLDLTPLMDGAIPQHCYAPWRDDPRPLDALLHGAYAHLGVADFWRRQRHLDDGEMARQAHVEFARWRDGTRDVVATLQASGALTQLGTRFVAGMATTLATWGSEPVPAAAAKQARLAAQQHRAAWQNLNNSATRDPG